MNFGSFKNVNYKLFAYNIYIYVCVCVCVCEHDLALNNPQGLICHKTQADQTNHHCLPLGM